MVAFHLSRGRLRYAGLVLLAMLVSSAWCMNEARGQRAPDAGERKQGGESGVKVVFRGVPKTLTRSEKLQKAIDAAHNANLHLQPKGLTGFVELSVQKPFVKDAAYFDYYSPLEVHSASNVIYGLGDRPECAPYNTGLFIALTIKVARANTPHLITCYIDSNANQDFRIQGPGSFQTQQIQSGPVVVACVVIPTATGDCVVLLGPTKKGFNFSKVDVDVVE
jgi:hypothetical protein